MTTRDAAKMLSELTDRQLEILRLYCDGWDYKSIADELYLAEGTVRVHMGNIYQRLELELFNMERRRKLLFEVYCPILKTEPIQPSPSTTSTPDPVPDHIMKMVEDDENAIVPYQSTPIEIIKIPDPPPPDPENGGRSRIWLGMILGIGIIGVILYALWRSGFIIIGPPPTEVSELPPEVQVIDDEAEPEEIQTSPTSESRKEVVVPTSTSPPPTHTQKPTDIPTSTPIPDTQPSAVLELGQGWRRNGLILTLVDTSISTSNTKECRLGLGFYIENQTSSSVILNVRTDLFTLMDNLDDRWQNTGLDRTSHCPDYIDRTYTDEIDLGDKSSTFFIGFRGPITNKSVDYVIVTVGSLLGFDGAQWKIPIIN